MTRKQLMDSRAANIRCRIAKSNFSDFLYIIYVFSMLLGKIKLFLFYFKRLKYVYLFWRMFVFHKCKTHIN